MSDSTYGNSGYIGVRTYQDVNVAQLAMQDRYRAYQLHTSDEMIDPNKAGRNESLEIYNCIKDNGPITAEAIAVKTEWNRHLVDTALGIMVERGLIYQSRATEDKRKDPMYKASPEGEREVTRRDDEHL
jgi:DNA-binding MarR family transcriptional regulator